MCKETKKITEYPLYLHEDENGKSEIIGRKGKQVRRVETGGGMPEGGEPYKQLVTDGSGNTVWEDRLAYEDGSTGTVKTIDPKFLPETGGGALIVTYTTDSEGNIVADKTFDEIEAAFNAGKYIEARNVGYMGMAEVYRLFMMMPDRGAGFALFTYDSDTNSIQTKVITHMADNTIHFDTGAVVSAT